MPNLANLNVQAMLAVAVAFWGVLILFGLVMGLYRAAYHTNTRHQYFLAAKSYIFSFLIVLATLYIIQFVESPRKFTLLFFLFLPFLFVLGRFILNRFNIMMQKRGFGINRALIVGYGNDGREVFRRFKGFPELGYDIRGFVSAGDRAQNLPIQLAVTELNPAGENSLPHYSMSMLTAS
jgi:FlaA1/EpsC-like NDP-sugar epimerase